MRLGRLDIGLWKYERKMTLKEWLEISYVKSLCGCHIITISKVCITWLSDECLKADQ